MLYLHVYEHVTNIVQFYFNTYIQTELSDSSCSDELASVKSNPTLLVSILKSLKFNYYNIIKHPPVHVE